MSSTRANLNELGLVRGRSTNNRLHLPTFPSRVRNPQLGVPVRLWLVGTRISRAIGEPSDGRNPCMPPISATADEVI